MNGHGPTINSHAAVGVSDWVVEKLQAFQLFSPLQRFYLRWQLKKGAIHRASRDKALAAEWFSIEH